MSEPLATDAGRPRRGVPAVTTCRIIVAYDRDRGIARDGKIPWDLPEDRRHFRAVTLGCSVIMGRKTWETLPGPLRDRWPVILSRTPIIGVPVAESCEDAIMAYYDSHGWSGIPWVIGGAQVYREALPHAVEVLATEVEGSHGCDLFFPPLPGEWTRRVVSRHEGFEVVRYTRGDTT